MKPLPNQTRFMFAMCFMVTMLCGCATAPKQKAEIGKAEPDINPLHASVGSQMLRAASNISAPDTLAVVLPPPAPVPPSFRFADGFLDNVWCLQSSGNLIDWVNAEPNPQAPQYPVWHWGYGDGLGNVPTNLPPNTGEALVVYRWKGMPW